MARAMKLWGGLLCGMLAGAPAEKVSVPLLCGLEDLASPMPGCEPGRR